ncbi:exodeoxyribonuclease VII large subunit [soil metagenome]
MGSGWAEAPWAAILAFSRRSPTTLADDREGPPSKMSSLPLFDRPGIVPAEAPMLSVSQLTALVREVLETGFGDVGVCGEVSNVARPRSGHVYFSLKDEGASIRAVLWKSAAQRLAFNLEDGLAVRAWGGLSLYAPRGDYQLVVRRIEPEGIGALELAFRQTVSRLAAEGLFDPARKRPLPAYPSRIVLVSSSTGAAVRDLLQVIGRRWPSVEVLIAPAKVQGLGAAEEIAAGIALANRLERADLIIVARGGGSLEDLWAFNEEIVARAIFHSRLPVVSGVGHEVDVTIADLVADVRALTPSEAGERCTPDAREVRNRLDRLADRLARALRQEAVAARHQLDALADRAARAVRRGLDRRADRLARLAAQLDALSPLAVLTRGYSLTQRLEDGRIVRSAADVRPGDLLRTRLASGEVISRVESNGS